MARRISKRRERIKKILDILDKGKATFEMFLKEIKCGRVTLSKDLKMLVNSKILKKHEDPKDARIKWYEKIVAGPDDRAKAEKGKYASTDFIENLETPVYGFKRTRDGKQTVSVFMSPVEEHQREFAQKKVNGMVNTYARVLRLAGSGLLPGRKIAVVLTLEG